MLRPGDSAHDTFYSKQLIAEGHRRLTSPLYILVFTIVAMAAMLSGNFSRRGNTSRVLVAIAAIFVLQLASLGLFNMSRQSLSLVPLLYALPLASILVGLTIIIRARMRRPSGLAMADG